MIFNVPKQSSFYQKVFIVAVYVLATNVSFGQTSLVENSSNNLTLLIFSGSDWCLPCIRFDREVVEDPKFETFIKGNLSLQIADFPQHKKLTSEEIAINEALAEKYNPQGYFPHVILLNREGELLTEIKTNKASTADVIAQLRPYLRSKKLKEVSASLILMGSGFQITIIAEETKAPAYLAQCIKEIQDIEAWLSSWQTGSITSKINLEAGEKPVYVPKDYYQLLERSIAISKLTQGAFDVTFNGLSDLYKFDKQEHSLPDQAEIERELLHIGYDKIELLDNQGVSFNKQLVKIGFGAIGKGFAADRVRKLMQDKGVKAGVINASGDLTTWGEQINGEDWKIGIPDPEAPDNIILWLPIMEKAIATSGDYEKYFTNNGIRYSHIINPRTGLPVQGSSSVSVISSSAELSDALATAVSVLGLDVGMNLINQLDGIECVFIDNNRKLHFSSGLQSYAY